MRVDKYLWSIRLYKTRTLATQKCKQNRVRVNGDVVKPSRVLKLGDTIEAEKLHIYFKFKVLEFPKGRVGAKLVPTFTQDITPHDQLEKLDLMRVRVKHERAQGLGRPTKKDRREMDSFLSSWDEWDEED